MKVSATGLSGRVRSGRHRGRPRGEEPIPSAVHNLPRTRPAKFVLTPFSAGCIVGAAHVRVGAKLGVLLSQRPGPGAANCVGSPRGPLVTDRSAPPGAGQGRNAKSPAMPNSSRSTSRVTGSGGRCLGSAVAPAPPQPAEARERRAEQEGGTWQRHYLYSGECEIVGRSAGAGSTKRPITIWSGECYRADNPFATKFANK